MTDLLIFASLLLFALLITATFKWLGSRLTMDEHFNELWFENPGSQHKGLATIKRDTMDLASLIKFSI